MKEQPKCFPEFTLDDFALIVSFPNAERIGSNPVDLSFWGYKVNDEFVSHLNEALKLPRFQASIIKTPFDVVVGFMERESALPELYVAVMTLAPTLQNPDIKLVLTSIVSAIRKELKCEVTFAPVEFWLCSSIASWNLAKRNPEKVASQLEFQQKMFSAFIYEAWTEKQLPRSRRNSSGIYETT